MYEKEENDMALKDVFTNVLGSILGHKDDEVPKSEIIDTTDLSKIPAEMLEELSNGKGEDD